MNTKELFEKQQLDFDLLHTAFNKINECYSKMHPKFIYEKPLNLRFYVPEYFLSLLHRYYRLVSNSLPELTKDNELKMFGIEVFIGYENKVILAHKDAPIYPECKSEVFL